LPRGRAARARRRKSRAARCRLVLQRLDRGSSGRHGRQCDARPEAGPHAGGQDREIQNQGSEAMMLTILSEAALRAFVLGSAVWLGLSLFRVRNPNAHMTAWTLLLLASLAMPLLMHCTKVTITVQAPP